MRAHGAAELRARNAAEGLSSPPHCPPPFPAPTGPARGFSGLAACRPRVHVRMIVDVATEGVRGPQSLAAGRGEGESVPSLNGVRFPEEFASEDDPPG